MWQISRSHPLIWMSQMMVPLLSIFEVSLQLASYTIYILETRYYLPDYWLFLLQILVLRVAWTSSSFFCFLCTIYYRFPWLCCFSFICRHILSVESPEWVDNSDFFLLNLLIGSIYNSVYINQYQVECNNIQVPQMLIYILAR